MNITTVDSNGGSWISVTDSDYDHTVISANDNEIMVDMTRGYHPAGDENSYLEDRFVIVKTDTGWRIEPRNGWKAQARIMEKADGF